MKTFSLTRIALLSLIAMGAVHADEVSRVSVKYGDLNLNSPQGAATMYQRLAQAAHSACKTLDPADHSVRLTLLYQACVQQAVSGAVSELNRPLVTQYATGRVAFNSLRLAVR
jgi:UrcA family protein